MEKLGLIILLAEISGRLKQSIKEQKDGLGIFIKIMCLAYDFANNPDLAPEMFK